MKEVSSIVVTLGYHYRQELLNLSAQLSPFLPPNAILAVDCVPRQGSLNAFHYVDGRDDAETFFILEDKQEEDNKILQKAKKFHINYQAGAEIGLWSQLDFFQYEDQINWNEAFVVKKATGEMLIYDPAFIARKAEGKITAYELKLKGISTKVAILKFLHQPGTNFYQAYHEPLCGPQDHHRIATYRMLLSLEKGKETKFIGGLWTSTPDNTRRLKGVDDVRIGIIKV